MQHPNTVGLIFLLSMAALAHCQPGPPVVVPLPVPVPVPVPVNPVIVIEPIPPVGPLPPGGDPEKYDFIVIGAGAAGNVVANRLTEIPNIRVLLLDAGQNETLESEIPLAAGALQLTALDWNFTSTRQEHTCLGVKNQTCLWPQGHVLGGSSILNYMIFVRGNKRDYNRWADIYGNTNWSFEKVFPYFMKLENFTGTLPEDNHKFHHVGGPMTIGHIPYHTVLADSFVKAGNENGYLTNDYNAEIQTGVERIQANIRDGQRCSTNKAYLWPIVNTRPNFVLKTGALVTKIIMEGNKAVGVEYEIDGKPHRSTVSKEVILSAGALNSPQLLMLSGIGPIEELKKFNIPVVVPSEGVGRNFQDHVACGGIEWLIDKPLSLVNKRVINNVTEAEWADAGTGPLTIPAQVEATAFIHTDPAASKEDYPDIQLFYFSGSPASDGGTGERYTVGFTDEVWNGYYEPIIYRDTYSIYPVLLRPKSRGTISIRSKDPHDAPLIDPAYYTDPERIDITTMVKGIKVALNFGNAKAWSDYDPKFHDAVFPTCKTEKYASDAYWECLARSFISINFHPASSNTMGDRKKFPNAVVDQRLRVYGAENLRVVDASVMPEVVSGNTNGPTIMIGEMASDIIKQDYGLPTTNPLVN